MVMTWDLISEVNQFATIQKRVLGLMQVSPSKEQKG